MDQSVGPGTRLGGYEILSKLGAGAMGVVFRARQLSLAREVALKLLPVRLEQSSDDVTRFHREGRIQAQLSHPHLVKVHDRGREGPWLFIAMDLVPGQSLGALLRGKGKLEIGRATEVTRQVADALAYLHQENILHRDIKPDNILIDEAGKARLTDFGLARFTEDTLLTREQGLVGTMAYMAPEVVSGKLVGPAADVYSLGVVLYQLLSGEIPYEVNLPAEFIRQVLEMKPRPFAPELHVPPRLVALIDQLLAKEAADRPTSAELVERLTDLRTSRPQAALRPGTQRLSRPVGAVEAEAGPPTPPGGPVPDPAFAPVKVMMITGAMLLTGIMVGAIWRELSAPAPMRSPAVAASGLTTRGEDGPRERLLQRFENRLSTQAPPIHLVPPGTETVTFGDRFWKHRARLDSVDPAALAVWFLVLELEGLRSVGLSVEPPAAAADGGTATLPELRVNGIVVPVQPASGGRWNASIPPARLKLGLNHLALFPDPRVRSAGKIHLTFDPPRAPRPVAPPPLPSPPPDAAFRRQEDACFHSLYSGQFYEAEVCFTRLEAAHPALAYAAWQVPHTESHIGRGSRDLQSSGAFGDTHRLLPGNIRDLEEAARQMAAAIDKIHESLRRDPRYGMTWRVMGECLAVVGQYEMSWTAMMHGCTAMPDDPMVWFAFLAVTHGESTPGALLQARHGETREAAELGLSMPRTPFGDPASTRARKMMTHGLATLDRHVGKRRSEGSSP